MVRLRAQDRLFLTCYPWNLDGGGSLRVLVAVAWARNRCEDIKSRESHTVTWRRGAVRKIRDEDLNYYPQRSLFPLHPSVTALMQGDDTRYSGVWKHVPADRVILDGYAAMASVLTQ